MKRILLWTFLWCVSGWWMPMYSIAADSKHEPTGKEATQAGVYKYMLTDFEKARRIMEALRKNNRLPAWDLDHVEGDLYFNNGRYYQALKYYGSVLECNKAKYDRELRMEMLQRMVSCYDMLHNEARKAEFLKKLMNEAKAAQNKAMEAVAWFGIGKSQYNQGDKKGGYKNMERGVQMMSQTNYKNKYDHLRYDYNTLLIYYEQDRRGADAARTLNKLMKVLHAETGREADIDRMDAMEQKQYWAHRTVVYNLQNQPEKADEAYRKYQSVKAEHYRYDYLTMPYLFARKKYDEIFRISYDHLKRLQSLGDTVNYHATTVRKNLAKAFFDIGDYRNAALNYKALATLRDSIKKEEQASTAQELAAVYELSERDNTILEQRIQFLIFSGVIFTLLVVVLFYIWYGWRIRKAKKMLEQSLAENEKQREELMRSLQALEEAQEQMDLQEQYITANLTTKEAEDEKDDMERAAIDKLIRTIKEKELYLQPGLAQRDMAPYFDLPVYRLGTAFRRVTGESFSDYINRQRVEHAKRLLPENPNYTVESIAQMCGFSNKQNFHRCFLSLTGTTPSAYREAHQQNSGESQAE